MNHKTISIMIKRVLTFMFAVLLSVVGGKAEGIP